MCNSSHCESDSEFQLSMWPGTRGSNRATHGSQTVTVANPTSHVTHYKINQAHRILGMHNHKVWLNATGEFDVVPLGSNFKLDN